MASNSWYSNLNFGNWVFLIKAREKQWILLATNKATCVVATCYSISKFDFLRLSTLQLGDFFTAQNDGLCFLTTKDFCGFCEANMHCKLVEHVVFENVFSWQKKSLFSLELAMFLWWRTRKALNYDRMRFETIVWIHSVWPKRSIVWLTSGATDRLPILIAFVRMTFHFLISHEYVGAWIGYLLIKLYLYSCTWYMHSTASINFISIDLMWPNHLWIRLKSWLSKFITRCTSWQPIEHNDKEKTRIKWKVIIWIWLVHA